MLPSAPRSALLLALPFARERSNGTEAAETDCSSSALVAPITTMLRAAREKMASAMIETTIHRFESAETRTQPRLCSAKRPPPAIARGDNPRDSFFSHGVKLWVLLYIPL